LVLPVFPKKSRPTNIMKSALPTAAVVLGFVLLVASALWAVLFPASRGWTEEKSARMIALGDRAGELQRQRTQAEARPGAQPKIDIEALKKEEAKVAAEYKVLYDEFNGAEAAPKTASRILRWSGIAFVVAGAIVVFANRGG
jgi:hypothetical protein